MSLTATEICIRAKYFAVCRGGRDHHVCQSFYLWNNEFETLLPLLSVTYREKERNVTSRLHKWV